jgi:hypothetical protein
MHLGTLPLSVHQGVQREDYLSPPHTFKEGKMVLGRSAGRVTMF